MLIKFDDNQFRDYIYEFYALGVGDPIPVSGSHGIGIGDLLDQIINQLDLQDEETNEDEISFQLLEDQMLVNHLLQMLF